MPHQAAEDCVRAAAIGERRVREGDDRFPRFRAWMDDRLAAKARLDASAARHPLRPALFAGTPASATLAHG